MTTYQSPGVYIKEIAGAKSIQAAGTSVVAFVGFTKSRPAGSAPGEPRMVASWTQFLKEFGDEQGAFVDGYYLPMSVYGYFENGGGICYVISLATSKEMAQRSSSKAERPKAVIPELGLIAQSKSSDLVSVSVEPGAAPEEFKVTLRGPGGAEEVFDKLSLAPGDGANSVAKALRASKLVTVTEVETKGERKVVTKTYPMSAPAAQSSSLVSAKELEGDPTAAPRTGLAGLEAVEDVTIVCMPDLMSGSPADIASYQKTLVSHCERMKDRVAILDTPLGMSVQDVRTWSRETLNVNSAFAALYYPWIRVRNPLANGSGEKTVLVPPSGHLAGVYARVDRERGVHKAPANEEVFGAIDVERKVITTEQDQLNPIGINCIRSFSGRGIRIWGARTLAGGESEWRYINVRRLFNMLEESIYEGTQWAVFEPNDQLLWARLRRDIGSFLKRVWMQGALFGATPEEAYYVKCDSENNPPETRDNGELHIEVGIAPVKPAEFIIISFKQISGVAQ